jgi:C1A family cysteine protease
MCRKGFLDPAGVSVESEDEAKEAALKKQEDKALRDADTADDQAAIKKDYAHDQKALEDKIDDDKIAAQAAPAAGCHCDAKDRVRIGGYRFIQPNNETALKAAVAEQPVLAFVEADSISFRLYKSGVYNDPQCGNGVDQAVLVVGYGVDTHAGSHHEYPYWLVRMDWGLEWGESGYMKLLRADEQVQPDALPGSSHQADRGSATNGPGLCGVTFRAPSVITHFAGVK